MNGFLLWFVIGFLTMLCILTFAQGANSHDAPTGWSYDMSCCNTVDCREVDGPFGPRKHAVRVTEVQGGYRISTTGEFISWKSRHLRVSKDEFYHWCSQSMGADDSATICLYVPTRAY